MPFSYTFAHKRREKRQLQKLKVVAIINSTAALLVSRYIKGIKVNSNIYTHDCFRESGERKKKKSRKLYYLLHHFSFFFLLFFLFFFANRTTTFFFLCTCVIEGVCWVKKSSLSWNYKSDLFYCSMLLAYTASSPSLSLFDSSSLLFYTRHLHWIEGWNMIFMIEALLNEMRKE